MNEAELKSAKRKVMAQGFPSSGGDLEGMIIDFHEALGQSPLLTLRWVQQTGEPDCMIQARCEPAMEALAIPEIVAEVERIWMDDLRYHSYEAHALSRRDFELWLEFVTSMEPGGHYVTGRIAVDVSKIQGPIKAVTFWYRLAGSGWSEAGIFDGVDKAFLTASYLSDALRELTGAVIALLQGREAAQCAWQEEPGEYRWIFRRRGDHLKIDILWFTDTFSTEADEQGKPVFSSECSLLRFAGELRDQLAKLLDEHGAEGYQRSWGTSFPQEEYRRLEDLIAKGRPENER